VLSLRHVRGGIAYVYTTLAPSRQDSAAGPAFCVQALGTLVVDGVKPNDDVVAAQLLSALDCLHDASTVVSATATAAAGCLTACTGSPPAFGPCCAGPTREAQVTDLCVPHPHCRPDPPGPAAAHP
jgi:hypothetical protein